MGAAHRDGRLRRIVRAGAARFRRCVTGAGAISLRRCGFAACGEHSPLSWGVLNDFMQPVRELAAHFAEMPLVKGSNLCDGIMSPVERAKGFEPSTATLARVQLRPWDCRLRAPNLNLRSAGAVLQSTACCRRNNRESCCSRSGHGALAAVIVAARWHLGARRFLSSTSGIQGFVG
jgi:hypothetical protein